MNKNKLNEVLNTKVSGKSIETYFANLLAEAESKDIDLEKVKLQNSVLKQWNSHHREINASYRIEIRDKEVIIDAQKMALANLREINKE